MSTQTVAIALDTELLASLDNILVDRETDRDSAINEALENYLAVQQFQREEILAGLRDADEGRTSSLEEVMERAKLWGR